MHGPLLTAAFSWLLLVAGYCIFVVPSKGKRRLQMGPYKHGSPNQTPPTRREKEKRERRRKEEEEEEEEERKKKKSWGSAVLAMLYRELCRTTDPSTMDIDSGVVSWQSSTPAVRLHTVYPDTASTIGEIHGMSRKGHMKMIEEKCMKKILRCGTTNWGGYLRWIVLWICSPR
ncbi:hypothetical protein PVK06_012397 [Gossypium arboreum]|uniref:Uncharacterized protein n=1 Tax=Gossypium arboreum TaxID=29729 RepID=A0ABR0QCJ0_GOSAR|nr:hypothetical protein PVK06_012397 [Gossypium arboreum]